MISSKPKALVVLSGGQDSTTCLFWAISLGYDVYAVTFDYDHRHRIEIESAQLVVKMSGMDFLKHEIIYTGAILRGTSPLVSGAKLEQYQNHSSLPAGLEKTFVPMRNQLFLTVAANRAFVLGADILITGVCEEDYGGYPDCRQNFIDAVAHASTLGTFNSDTGFNNGLQILTPLMALTKAEAVKLALSLPGCYEALAYTHTAYDGVFPPTGHDHATLLRVKGFEEAGVPDPLVLRAHIEGKMDIPATMNYSSAKIAEYSARLNFWPF